MFHLKRCEREKRTRYCHCGRANNEEGAQWSIYYYTAGSELRDAWQIATDCARRLRPRNRDERTHYAKSSEPQHCNIHEPQPPKPLGVSPANLSALSSKWRPSTIASASMFSFVVAQLLTSTPPFGGLKSKVAQVKQVA